MRVLVVDDEPLIRNFLRTGLRYEGFEIAEAESGDEALEVAASFRPDLVILDIMLPGIDGHEVCRRLRGDPKLGILMLTARDEVHDRVIGLDLGADDYLVKPFDFGELLARVRALQRRPRGVDSPTIERGRLTLDPVTRVVAVDGRVLSLTSTEYRILELLMRRSPAVVDRKAIAEHGWADETDPLGSNAIDVQMSRLRAKLPNAGIRIVTVRGAGYRLDDA
ncbi:MAG TPA: response regulator transcription factor [Candidatus Limnocylindrales bacterium]